MDRMRHEPVLEIGGLSVSFFDRAVLSDVNLSVPQGGIAVLVGVPDQAKPRFFGR